jgi:cobalt-zinc-cadmium efflux system protein
MSEHHHHHHEVSGKNLFITIILNIIITVAQVVGGIFSGSLALISDALHNFSDVMALVIAWWANKVSQRKHSAAKTFGYKRAQIIAALFNGSVLVGIGFYLIIEALGRFTQPQVIESSLVIWLALLSIVLNAASVLLIKDDSHGNLNIRAAYLHLLTDVMTSIAVLVGGLLMMFKGWYWVDPLVTMVIAVYLIHASWSLISESVSILMMSAPQQLDLSELQALIAGHEKVANIHHIHLWQLDENNLFLEAHLDFTADLPLSEVVRIKDLVAADLQDKMGVNHVTLQCEFEVDDSKDMICNH